jgi:nucleotide-binding universal stress UspA family protein
MKMRVIFVPVADRPECAHALFTSFTLGKHLGASVTGCHIRARKSSPVSLSSTSSLLHQDGDEAEWQFAAKPEKGKRQQQAAEVLFTQVAAHHGFRRQRKPGPAPGAIWMEKTGSPGKVIGIMGPISDLLVVSRPLHNSGMPARLFLSAALLKSGRPVLVLPQNRDLTVGRKICIAWNQSLEAARAVAAAMPLLQKAETVSIVNSGPETQLGPKSVQLATYLKHWGIQAERLSSQGRNPTGEIMEMYRSSGSDLMLMGAYTRGRMSRLVFGGVTEYMLEKATIPVLMLHT